MDKNQIRLVRVLTILVALDAMILSYHALAERAAVSGIVWWLSWLYPLAIDGLLGAAMLAAYALRDARLRVRGYVWGVIGFGIGVSVLGNALPTGSHSFVVVDMLFRAVPPISLALSLHLLIVLDRYEAPEQQVEAPAWWPKYTIAIPQLTEEEAERFVACIEPLESGCWLWTAKKTEYGYGRLSIRAVTYAAHRVAYEHFIESIGAGLTIDHTCVNPSCVNPTHLESVTDAENNIRKITRARERGWHHPTKGSKRPRPPRLVPIVDAPSASESGSAKARALLAEARAEGRQIRPSDLAEQAGISESRARAVIYEKLPAQATG